VKQALEKGDATLIKSAHDDLNTHMQKIGEVMQQQGASAQAAPQGPSEKANKPDIEEAEVEILDKDDK
jgi:hypothetical protein